LAGDASRLDGLTEGNKRRHRNSAREKTPVRASGQARMTMRCVPVLWALIALVVICTGCTTAPAPGMVEEYAVYAAVVESLLLGEDVELIVLRNQTAVTISEHDDLAGDVQHVREQLGPAIERDTLNDYQRKNKKAHELEECLSVDVPCALLSAAEEDAIFREGGGWSEFYETYPRSQGILSLSRVGFNQEADQAVVYVGNQADYKGGLGQYLLLTQDGGIWTVDDRVVTWVS
jgi:hypothetical protein